MVTTESRGVVAAETLSDNSQVPRGSYGLEFFLQTVDRYRAKCTCLLLRYRLHYGMIESFRHKGLRKLYEDGETRFLPADEVGKIKRILSYLEAAEKPQALNLPGYRFHQLKGEYRGFYSVSVTGNNRIIFRFVDGNAVDVDYLDYH
jgi:proteic killer suppression protein